MIYQYNLQEAFILLSTDPPIVFMLFVVVFIIVILIIGGRYSSKMISVSQVDDQSIYKNSYFLFPPKLPIVLIQFLEKNYLFYRRLDARKRRKFNSRVIKFIANKKFIGRDNLAVTSEMRVLIAGSAICVSWGLNNYIFPTFHTILIYPEKFYSGFAKAIVRGETNMVGVIVFSWKDFEFGLSDTNDNLNLGYHEFGHALFVERFNNTLDGSFNRNYDKWRELVFSGSKLEEAELKHTFRDYATYNEHEFFAVSVETFFERPEQFRKDLPHLYTIMVKMLKQDPLQPIRRYDQKSY